MKPFLAILSGFVLTLAVFGGGTAFGTFFIAGKSVQDLGPGTDAADVWTNEPRKVDVAAQELERLPALPVAADPQVAGGGDTDTAGEVQVASLVATTTTTSARPDDDTDALANEPFDRDPALYAELEDAHIDWCASRYRSYRPRDDSYTPYSGGRRPCVSPYSEQLDGIAEPLSAPPATADSFAEDAAGDDYPLLGYASAELDVDAYATRDHIAYCFSRYRSYRPEDNSYQPYGGGPRQQCR